MTTKPLRPRHLPTPKGYVDLMAGALDQLKVTKTTIYPVSKAKGPGKATKPRPA